MHERLTKKALEPILRRLRTSASEADTIGSHLAENAIVVPHPGYGRIVYDVPDNYVFPQIKKKMDAEAPRYRDYFERNLKGHYFSKRLEAVPAEPDGSSGFHWKNGYFPPGDARTLFAMVSSLAPRRFLEVGVGNSTKIARMAIEHNGLPTRIASIDPAPRADVSRFSDEVTLASVTSVDLSVFESLRAGDVLFIDGSHVCHIGTDVPFFFLNVFPGLAEGVIVHIHDIFLPWEYYENMRVRHYNEQHMLGAMIGNSPTWEVLFPVHYASQAKIIPHGGGSFWFRKTAARSA